MSQDRELFSDRMLEGEYTAWTWLWTRNYGGGVSLLTPCVDNLGTTYVTRSILTSSYIVTRANVSTIIANYHFESVVPLVLRRVWSATRKYVIATKTNPPAQIGIFRYGVNIANVPYQTYLADAQFARGMSVSPNGRYIAIVFRSTATGADQYLVLLEGV